MAATSQLLAELCLEDFEPAFCRLGIESAERLKLVRYEELLEMGLSKVQCHLFLEKVSTLAANAGGEPMACEPRGDSDILTVLDVRDPQLAEDLARQAACDADYPDDDGCSTYAYQDASICSPPTQRRVLHARRAGLRSLMPPPNISLAPEMLDAPRSCKRQHSSHRSTAAARGSERRTASSASSGSSSLLAEGRFKRRRMIDMRQMRRDDALSGGPRGSSLRSALDEYGTERERRGSSIRSVLDEYGLGEGFE